MEKHTTPPLVESSPTWEHLETWVRSKMRERLQGLLEAEVDELLSRRESERRKTLAGTPSCRSGQGKPRRVTLSGGTVTVPCRVHPRNLELRRT